MRYELILASASPRRQELLALLQLPYSIQPSDVNEQVDPKFTPAQIVEELAMRKASAVSVQRQAKKSSISEIIIGADTIVVVDGQVLGKPQDEADAVRMLSLLEGRDHFVFSGVACMDQTMIQRNGHPVQMEGLKFNKDGSLESPYGQPEYLGATGQYHIRARSSSGQPSVLVGHTVSRVLFRPMSDDEIYSYVRTGVPLDKAGAYGIQGIGARFIERIEGDFYSIMGLPINLLYPMLLTLHIPLHFMETAPKE